MIIEQAIIKRPRMLPISMSSNKMFSISSHLYFRTVYGRPYTSFFGIRYAQNPVDSLFLQKPIPALPWNELYVADQEIKCLQVSVEKHWATR
jgi:hypothetical protein